jgi:hypothetical protein
VSVELLTSTRDQILPMLRFVAEEYRHRVPEGYPVVLDSPDRGVVGIELDSSYALYFVTDGEHLMADLYYRSPRHDARSSASREKFGGAPFQDRRSLGVSVSDQTVRNLLAELKSRWNFQPSLIHMTDT